MVKIGIIGTGIWAPAHVSAYQRTKGVEVSACCDIVGKKARTFARKHKIARWYADYAQMLAREQLDGVSVVTSDAAHAPVSIAALKRGLAVLCEKPLATTTQDARRMVETARRQKVVNLVNFTCRGSSALTKARQLVQSGRLGEIRHAEASYLQTWLSSRFWGDWRKDPAWLRRLSKAKGGGTLEDVGCHILDLVTFVVGDIARINCELKNFDKGIKGNRYKGYMLNANDSAVMTLEFAQGALGTVTTTRWAAGRANSVYLKVYGTKGGLEMDLDRSWTTLNVCLGADIHKCRWKKLACGKKDSVYRRFVRSIRTGRNESPSFAEGARIQDYLEKCHFSFKSKKQVMV